MRAQGADEGAADVDHGAHVDGEFLAQPRGVLLVERAEGAEARVVDQARDRDAASRELFEERVGDPVRAEVHRDGRDLDPVRRRELRGQLLQAVGAAGDQDEVGSAGGEPACELLAEPGAGARDQCGLAPVVDRVHEPSPLRVVGCLPWPGHRTRRVPGRPAGGRTNGDRKLDLSCWSPPCC